MPLRIPSPDRFPSIFGRILRPVAWLYFAALLLLTALLAFLWKSGRMLVHIDALVHTRWAVVLPGEERDFDRIDEALSLFQQGYFDSLILSGPRIFKNRYISEFSSEYLIAKGFPRDRIFQLQNEGQSSAEEAALIVGQARRLGIDTLLIITSDYHTARVHRIYNRLAAGYPAIRLNASQGVLFDPEAWWSTRDSRETWVLEWIKTLNTSWENRKLKPLEGTPEISLLLPEPRAASGETALPAEAPPEKPAKAADSSHAVADTVKTTANDTATVTESDSGSRRQ